MDDLFLPNYEVNCNFNNHRVSSYYDPVISSDSIQVSISSKNKSSCTFFKKEDKIEAFQYFLKKSKYLRYKYRIDKEDIEFTYIDEKGKERHVYNEELLKSKYYDNCEIPSDSKEEPTKKEPIKEKEIKEEIKEKEIKEEIKEENTKKRKAKRRKN